MKIKVSDNTLQVAKNFEKQVREQPFIVKKALGRTAEFLIFLIKSKTKKGVDYQGNSFTPYTKEYKEFRQKSGKGTRPDLIFSGNMLAVLFKNHLLLMQLYLLLTKLKILKH
jgi:hypothetical protein